MLLTEDAAPYITLFIIPTNSNLKSRPIRYDPIGSGVSLPPIQSRKNKTLPNNFPEA